MSLRDAAIIVGILMPTVVLSSSRAEIPTSIQVVDERGRTTVAPAPLPSASDEGPLKNAIAFPPECRTLARERADAFPEDHPVRSRLESDRASLARLSTQVSFAPYVSRSDDAAIALLVNALPFLETTEREDAMACLDAMASAYRSRGGPDLSSVISTASSTSRGMVYGLSVTEEGIPYPPRTIEEARYASDHLRLRHPSVTSMTVSPDLFDLRFKVHAHVLGMFSSSGEARVTIDGDAPSLHTPWWWAFSDGPDIDLSALGGRRIVSLAERFSFAERVLEAYGL